MQAQVSEPAEARIRTCGKHASRNLATLIDAVASFNVAEADPVLPDWSRTLKAAERFAIKLRLCTRRKMSGDKRNDPLNFNAESVR